MNKKLVGFRAISRHFVSLILAGEPEKSDRTQGTSRTRRRRKRTGGTNFKKSGLSEEFHRCKISNSGKRNGVCDFAKENRICYTFAISLGRTKSQINSKSTSRSYLAFGPVKVTKSGLSPTSLNSWGSLAPSKSAIHPSIHARWQPVCGT
ncbi:hypothetical protein TCAL_15781 [Tigriopus californicus]|uniref:Uncharacterized protein n=1 Tax=Tigriopus californicus TaxID=6832 RepID=A0A553P724_TIGCA|nr:hypothetical protein TCAL_15781 [Tigriopus californicus]